MRLRFTPRAVQDLTAIADYVREHSPAAAQRIRSAILDALQNLLIFPHAGRRQTVEGVRKLVTRKYHYIVYYMADAVTEEIIVLSIQHPSQMREHTSA
jgi:toxin ParE1/3/4